MSSTDWIVVGAGFTGATIAERIATVLGEKVLVVEQRDHVGGNAFDYVNEQEILVHKYGPHIFHTNSRRVWDYIRPFSEWRPYYHRVHAIVVGVPVPLPFNLNSIERLFPRPLADSYIAALLDRFRYGERVPILKLREAESTPLRELADFIYRNVFENYTRKQWGLSPEQLSPSVTARVPVVVGHDDRYFQDAWQMMPRGGYTALFTRMLDRRNITLLLSTSFNEIRAEHKGARIFYTGAIDEFFEYEYGPLPYRSLRFSTVTMEAERHQEVGTVNYPDAPGYTRSTEFKHLTGQQSPRTAIATEYPEAYEPGRNERYYPIPREETQEILNRYLALARGRDDVFFCGRLGDYKYYNMDQAIGAGLAMFDRQFAVSERAIGQLRRLATE